MMARTIASSSGSVVRSRTNDWSILTVSIVSAQIEATDRYPYLDAYPKGIAMLDVHNEGRAAVSNGSREEMERDVQAMHSYGLWATLVKDD